MTMLQGGTRNSMQEIADGDTDGFSDIETDISSHCFIPTVSALAISNVDLFHDINNDNNILSKTPFDAIYYPLNTNEEHVYISSACVGWILNELIPQNITLGSSSNMSMDTWSKGDVRATNSIRILPEFHVDGNSKFHAKIITLQRKRSKSESANIVDEDVNKNNIKIISNYSKII